MTDPKEHYHNTERISCYLKYLRDISRKIVSRNGFENCLLNKKIRFPVQINYLALKVSSIDTQYRDLDRYFGFLQKNPDKKLFIGYGLIAGEGRRRLAAPILILQCEISKEENTRIIQLEPDLGSLSINYDLLSSLSNNQISVEEDELDIFSEDETVVLNQIENKLQNIHVFDTKLLHHLAYEVFSLLKKNLKPFECIPEISNTKYCYEEEYNRLSNKPKSQSSNKAGTDSIFEGILAFVQANHFFINQIPDELSTYEALNGFVQRIDDQKDFKNPVLEKLLTNALSEKRAELEREPIEDHIEEVINHHIPLSLSSSQILGIKNAWTNEISYIQGPPGTGKSHTISAIVLSAIAMNKKVLVLSQKQAALKVVNKKIEPYITSDDGLIGVCYYDKDARRKIKSYCRYLKENVSSSTRFRTNFAKTTKAVEELEARLNSKISAVKSLQIRLENLLRDERQYKELNDEFLLECKRHSEIYSKIPHKYSFKKINTEKKYRQALNFINEIWAKNLSTLTTRLFVNKFKQHFITVFETPQEWLKNGSFPDFSHSFIKLNLLFTKLKNQEKKLNTDINSVRYTITNLKSDIIIIQEQLVKQKYKKNVLSFIENPRYQREIDKFNGMLTNVNSRLIHKKMKEIDFHKVTDVIPFWTAEIRHLGRLFPLDSDLFDLVIVDEASQVNLAEVLPAFYRGKKLCIVGDHQQLSLKASGLNFSLSKNFDQLTWEKHNTRFMHYQRACKRNLTVTQASILDMIKSDEYNIILPEVMLDEHFRSLPKLAKYTSKNFYKDEENPEGRLKIMTETPDKLSLNCFQAVRVNGQRDNATKSKVVEAEVAEVLNIISSITRAKNSGTNNGCYSLPHHISPNQCTLGVISMIRDQCERIKELIEERFAELDPSYELMVGTPEEFQGNERDIMIFSLCLDSNCHRGQGHYQDPKRLNVATSRAKSFTYFVYSPFDRTFNEIYKYLSYFKGEVTEEDLISEQPPIELTLTPLSFDKFESDFERYVYHYLKRYINTNQNHQITLHNQVTSCGQKRLDFVLYNHRTRKSVAIEVDGSHHFTNGFSENYTVEHIDRMNILTRAGWKIINTPYHKWYKDGWLSEENNDRFNEEIKRIYSEIDLHIM